MISNMPLTSWTLRAWALRHGQDIIPAGRMPTQITATPDKTAAAAANTLADRLYGLGFTMVGPSLLQRATCSVQRTWCMVPG